jgi:hypothetical protein
MGRSRSVHRARSGAVLLLALLLGVALLAMAGAAQATPTDPTMSLAELQTLLAASPTGTVDGYFKTVVTGTTIEQIPCTIVGVAPGQADDGGPLIVFNATGPTIDRLGGIAAGMSGSPIYVDDGAGDKLLGAVSYGVYGAGGGFGMATPVERMMSLDSLAGSAVGTRTLNEPVCTSAGLIDRVVVARSRAAAAAIKPAKGTLVLAPLAQLEVTGIPPDSRMFRTLQHVMANQGIDIDSRMLVAPTGAAPATPTPLVPGASVAAMLTRGDPLGPDYMDMFWGVGGVGTVTYTTTDGKLVAWGHSFLGSGTSSLYMNDANVLETVPSASEPFKMAVPGLSPRGEFSEDSLTGIAGTPDAMPAEVPITVHAHDTDTGNIVDTTSYVTQWVASQLQFAGLAPAAIWPALWQASGDAALDGTIAFTLQIKVTDGTTESTVEHSSVWDSSYDAASLVYLELALDIMRLTANVDGIATPTIESISVDATLTHSRDRARVADLSVPGGLKVGDNMVHVTLWPYGSSGEQTFDVPLTIPAGTMMSGTLYASAPFTGIEDLGGGWIGYYDPVDYDPAQRQSLGQIVADINAQPSANQLLVAYDPDNDQSWSMNTDWGGGATLGTVDAATFVVGEKYKSTTTMRLRALPARVHKGAHTFLHGVISHAAGPGTVSLFMRQAGSASYTLLADDVQLTPIKTSNPWGTVHYEFSFRTPRVRHMTVFKAVWNGDSEYLGATDSRTVGLIKH